LVARMPLMPRLADPIARFQQWFREARERGNALPEIAVLATADRSARPSARCVLLKRVDRRGFVFYTDATSRKGRELTANPLAALVSYWDETRKQVRIEGRVERVSPAEADADWAARPRANQLAILASAQSAELRRPRDLSDRVARAKRDLSGSEVRRPDRWTGYRLRPKRIEFWVHRADRLHRRELFTRADAGWRRRLLQP
ncbi:MAG: pyridoxamine 5'-phosphate oxidase, partial [Candidatus Binatia bacterium]